MDSNACQSVITTADHELTASLLTCVPAGTNSTIMLTTASAPGTIDLERRFDSNGAVLGPADVVWILIYVFIV